MCRHIAPYYNSGKSQVMYNCNVMPCDVIPQYNINTIFNIGYVTVGIFIRFCSRGLVRNRSCGSRRHLFVSFDS